MMYARETTAIIDEAAEKFVAHVVEVGLSGAKLNLDAGSYRHAESIGALRVFTAREDGILRGYAVYYTAIHPHYGNLQAVQDCLYVDPIVRGRFVGSLFLTWISKALAEEGVKHIFQSVPCSNDFGAMLVRLGFTKHEIVYHKNLEVQH